MNVKIFNSIACAIIAALLMLGISQINNTVEEPEISMCILEYVEVSY